MQQPSQRVIDTLRLPYIQQYINNNKFELMYDILAFGEASPLRSGREIGQLTQLLLASDIDPLENMSSIPGYFLFGSGISTFKVPKHIEIIQEQAFGKCYNLEEVILEGNLQGIHSEAFFQCSNIQRIVLGSNILHIGDRAFSAIPRGAEIIYKGTVEELNNIFISRLAFPAQVIIHCTDGDAGKGSPLSTNSWEKIS